VTDAEIPGGRVRELLIVFTSVFIAEIGDKTQLAAMLFATNSRASKTGVFIAASAALMSSTLLAVLVGGSISKFIGESTLKVAAGIGFIVVGIWTLISAYR
jgi:putative Ca2+/H+ antiporter (TMEM165/GDT1 family)